MLILRLFTRETKEARRKITGQLAYIHVFQKSLKEICLTKYMENHLSDHLCGFRKGYNTQQCLVFMLEKWKKALDKCNKAGALYSLTYRKLLIA